MHLVELGTRRVIVTHFIYILIKDLLLRGKKSLLWASPHVYSHKTRQSDSKKFRGC